MDFSFAVIFIYAVILGLVAPYITANSEKYGVLLPPTIALVTGSVLWGALTWLGMGYTDAWIWIIVMVAMPISMIFFSRRVAKSRDAAEEEALMLARSK